MNITTKEAEAIRLLGELHDKQGYVIANSLVAHSVGDVSEQSTADAYMGLKLRMVGTACREEFEDQLRAIGVPENIADIHPLTHFFRAQVLD